MITPLERLRNIETEFKVEQIKYKGQSFWPLFRSVILGEILYGKSQGVSEEPLRVFAKLKTAFFGFSSWFRKIDYIAFSNELERKIIEGKSADKLLERTMQCLNYEKFLYIENANNGHLNHNDYGEKRVCSWNILLIIIGLVSIWTRFRKNKFEDFDILEKIKKENDLNTNLKLKFYEFEAKVIVLKLVFRIYKPKCVFITDYGYYPMTYAAKLLGIKVVEYQHGVIGKVHPYYHPAKKLNTMFCPNFLFVFGDYDKDCLNTNYYVDSKNIIPIGNFYLEYMVQKQKNARILQLIEPYDKSICVPTNHITQEYILDFIRRVANKLSKVIFILTPRDYTAFEPIQKQITEQNIFIEKELSFQEVVRHCYYHSCTFSTCSLEALSLGVQNILIDDNGEASSYYGSLLSDPSTTKFAKSEEEYIEYVNNFIKQDKQYVLKSNSINYKANYSENLQLAIEILLRIY